MYMQQGKKGVQQGSIRIELAAGGSAALSFSGSDPLDYLTAQPPSAQKVLIESHQHTKVPNLTSPPETHVVSWSIESYEASCATDRHIDWIRSSHTELFTQKPCLILSNRLG